MKKIFNSAIFVFAIISFFGISLACENISFDDGSVCIDINKNGNTYTMSNGLNCPGSNCSLSCNILLPDNTTYEEVGSCNGNFTWNGNNQGLLKVRVTLNDKQKDFSKMYNFSLGRWDGGSTSPNINTDLYTFSLSTNRSYPTTSQRVDLNVSARNSNNVILTNYNNKVKFKVYYRSSSAYSWIETTSSNYYTIDSSLENGYSFYNSNYGQKNFSNFIRFNRNNYDYKVRVYDDTNSNVYNEITFYVGSTNSNTNTDLSSFYLSTNRSKPTISQRADLTIGAMNSNNSTLTNYNNRVKFKVYYRSSNSSSWTETTSSNYYTIDSNLENGYYFSTADYGQKTLSNFIKFNRNNYDYKVRVYDNNNTNIYNEVIFYVGSTNSNTNTDLSSFYLSTNRSKPTTSQRADLTIRARNSRDFTLTNYNNRVQFKVYYRSSSSSSWIETNSSTYYTMNSSFNNGYYFSTTDYGVKTLSNFIKFNRNNYDYKVKVYDNNSPSIYDEIMFYVGSSTNSNNNNDNTTINGFTVKEFQMVQRIYSLRPQLISQFKVEYPRLKNDTTRTNLGNNLYSNMKDVLDDKNSKKFTNYTKFFADFDVWYNHTMNVIH